MHSFLSAVCFVLQVDALEEQHEKLRGKLHEARAAAASEADSLEAEGQRIARQAHHLLELGSNVSGVIYYMITYIRYMYSGLPLA